MDTTVDALKKLYVALGGTAADVADVVLIPDMINAIAVIAASTIELPAVKKADEGSVLMVNGQGKWAKGAIPSQLPAVTAENDGSVLKVVNGAWDIGTDLVE